MIPRFGGLRSKTEKWLHAHGLARAAGLTLPDFLGIGAQKSGTTWLHQCLSHHPDVYLPPEKELHYFDEGFHRSLSSYARAFREGAGRIKGEITPEYGILPRERVRFVRAVMPGLRLILLLRNPIDRAWSAAVMNLASVPGRRFEDVSEAEFVAHFRSSRSLRRGDYLRIIEEWLSAFAEKRLLIGFFEEIQTQPRELLSRVFKHIGVGAPSDWTGFPTNEVIYAGPGHEVPSRLRAVLQEMYHSDIEELYRRFGDPVSSWRC